MKLERVIIRNFRGIEHLEMNLQDELGRIEDQVPIIGPNTSGKTSILDAIALCLMPVTEVVRLRPDLLITPASLVRRGSVRTEVSCIVRFSDDEIATAKEVFERVDSPYKTEIPSTNRVTVDWRYPDSTNRGRWGWHTFNPRGALSFFKGRITAVHNLHVPGVSANQLARLGGVFLFDQKRTGLAQRMTAEMRALAGQSSEAMDNSLPEQTDEFTQDPRLILLQLASRAQALQDPEATERGDYERLRDLYAKVCKPHKMKGLYNTESGLDMEFEGPNGVYLFNGLSSGQMMLLLLLLRFARQRIHNSIVLIDELELHLHPLWQSRLYQYLGVLGDNNQYFFTTHSMHLRDLIRGSYFHCTGELGDNAVDKQEA